MDPVRLVTYTAGVAAAGVGAAFGVIMLVIAGLALSAVVYWSCERNRRHARRFAPLH